MESNACMRCVGVCMSFFLNNPAIGSPTGCACASRTCACVFCARAVLRRGRFCLSLQATFAGGCLLITAINLPADSGLERHVAAAPKGGGGEKGRCLQSEVGGSREKQGGKQIYKDAFAPKRHKGTHTQPPPPKKKRKRKPHR